MTATPVQDWGKIDKSNITALRDSIPNFLGAKKEHSLLNSTLDHMLEIKDVATQSQVRVPVLSKLIQSYTEAVEKGTELKEQGLWKRIRKMREWHGSKEQFKKNCESVWKLAHQTSFVVHQYVDESKAGIARVSIRRRRSLDELVDQAELDLVQRHNEHGDTVTTRISTPPNTGVVAQSSSITTNMLSEETIRKIADMSAAKILERLSGRPPGGILQTVNHFHGCIVRPGRGAAPTVNFGGKNNRGAAMNTHPTEVEWNGADDIDGTSDDESHYDTATDATRSGSERHSSSAISLGAQSMQPPAGTSRSPSDIW